MDGSSTPATSVYFRDENDVQHLLDTMDWSLTSLGPRQDWPGVLDNLTSFAMHNTQPVSVWGGKDWNVIYNKPYSEVS